MHLSALSVRKLSHASAGNCSAVFQLQRGVIQVAVQSSNKGNGRSIEVNMVLLREPRNSALHKALRNSPMRRVKRKSRKRSMQRMPFPSNFGDEVCLLKSGQLGYNESAEVAAFRRIRTIMTLCQDLVNKLRPRPVGIGFTFGIAQGTYRGPRLTVQEDEAMTGGWHRYPPLQQ